MGKKSRRKGYRGEYQLVKKLREAELDAKRVPLSGQTEYAKGDVVVEGLVGEVKLRKDGFRQIYKWLENRDILFAKADRKEYLSIMRLETLIKILGGENNAMDEIQVFDGYVRLVRTDGTERQLAEIVRISYGKDENDLTDEDVERLIQLLLRNKHLSPFEFLSMVFKIKAPIFVARQWFRHRTGSYLEKSLRYTIAEPEFYAVNDEMEQYNQKAYEEYLRLIKHIRKEQARAILPMGTYTEFYWKIDLRNLMHFLELRLDKHAQYEIREYAKAIERLFEEKFPVIHKYWKERIV